MVAILRNVGATLCLLLFAVSASAQTVSVGTSASETATYGTTPQTAGPFPWSDLGISATATITPGVLNVATGGSTAFSLNSTITGGETLTPGMLLNVGYNPGWTGALNSAPAANGNLSSQFVYNIGPISGSDNLLNVPLGISSAGSSLTSSLNNQTSTLTNASANGPSVSPGLTLSAQACLIECVTIATASVNLTLGTQVQQTITTAPTITYGDLVWDSTTPSYSSSDLVGMVTGSAGNVQTPFLNAQVALPGITSGQTFYYNVLPFVSLDMPVTNSASVNVPASIDASYDVFGVFSGSKSFPLGNLYSLNTGDEDFDFNPTFYSSQFYSIPVEFTGCAPNLAACFSEYTVPNEVNPVGLITGGGPGNSGPCGATVIGCDVNIPGGPGSVGGYGVPNLGPLFPGDPSGSNICAPQNSAFVGDCINTVGVTVNTANAPEPGSFALLGFGLLGLAILSRRKLCS
jgi:hypothetical protein